MKFSWAENEKREKTKNWKRENEVKFHINIVLDTNSVLTHHVAHIAVRALYIYKEDNVIHEIQLSWLQLQNINNAVN